MHIPWLYALYDIQRLFDIERFIFILNTIIRGMCSFLIIFFLQI